MVILLKTHHMDFFNLIRKGELEQIKTELETYPALLETKNDRGFPPLVLATYSEQLEISEYFLEKGADINALDGAGNTALMGVCFKGYLDIVEMLLSKNAEVNIQNTHGATALIYASTFGQTAIAKLLLAAGADKTKVDERGNTALMHAKFQGVKELQTLLEEA
ncbi:ankyrin repeat domain-containing protein [Arcticibacterium luteifluviistationis]|nr:ankyrin repeat domain-containing protein [Arcticibacterium luteifluviistationis]